jgi:hypothetical protein
MMSWLQPRHVGRTALEVGVFGLGGARLGDLYECIPEERALATLETALETQLALKRVRLAGLNAELELDGSS